MSLEGKKNLVIDRINETLNELDDEVRFEQACILVGRIKGFLEISFLIGLISMEENEGLWNNFADVRKRLHARFIMNPLKSE